MNPRRQRLSPVLAILATAGMLVIADMDASAQEPPLPLSRNRELATKLIADYYEIGESEVKIAYILDGKVSADGFESDHGAEVTFIRTIVEEGRRRRRVESIQFRNDHNLGWFLRAIIKESTRTYIDICSERLGRIRIE